MKRFYLALCIFGSAAMAACAANSVEQWSVFELLLNGPTNGNPFLDVKFSARFTQGTNAVKANGFYDGDGIYRVRFMPEQIGEWKYKTTSNVRKLNGKTGEFNVTTPLQDNHGPVHVANTYHFAYADGTPYKELGTTCYCLLYTSPSPRD